MMSNTIIDEDKYAIAWRFNSNECNLKAEEISEIIFLDKCQSSILWKSIFIFDNLRQINGNNSYYKILSKKQSIFFENSSFVFSKFIKQEKIIFFFWGMENSAILSSSIFLKSWDDFFYPSDENCIIYMPSTKKTIYSFNEDIFLAKLL